MTQRKYICWTADAHRSGLWLWAFVGCVLAVLVLAVIPSPPRVFTTGWDKSNHLLAFAVMAWLGCQAFPRRVAIILLAYGALIEILQSFTPTRSAEWLDLLADCLGILLGWGLVWIAGVAAGANMLNFSRFENADSFQGK